MSLLGTTARHKGTVMYANYDFLALGVRTHTLTNTLPAGAAPRAHPNRSLRGSVGQEHLKTEAWSCWVPRCRLSKAISRAGSLKDAVAAVVPSSTAEDKTVGRYHR